MRTLLLLTSTLGLCLACGGGTVDSGILEELTVRVVGKCSSEQICESFDGGQFDPFHFRELAEEEPGHLLWVEAYGPGTVEVEMTLGPLTCGCDDGCELPPDNDSKTKTFEIELDDGYNLVELTPKVKKWHRESVAVTVTLDGESDSATAGGWPMCL